MTDVVFPAMSKDDADAAGVVATWFVADGETVAEGQLMAEVAMDKADMEVTAPAAGVVRLVIAGGGTMRPGGADRLDRLDRFRRAIGLKRVFGGQGEIRPGDVRPRCRAGGEQ